MRVECENLVMRYPGGVDALCGVSLSAASGTTLAVLGPSGCGKTTLLRVIAGLEPPNSGVVRFDEVDVSNLPPATRGAGLIAQDAGLYPHLSIGESIAMAATRTSRTEAEQRVREAAGTLGITGILSRGPGEVSGGERRRAALARELVRRARVMLLDEPTASLDGASATMARAEIADIRSRLGATVILVTHDQDEAFAMGDRIAVMRNGRIIQEGTPKQIYDRPADRFVASFVGRPGMAFIPGKITRDGGIWFESQGLAPLALPGVRGPAADRANGAVALGVRPSRLRLGSGEWILPVRRVERLVDRTEVTLGLPSGGTIRAIGSPPDSATCRVELDLSGASLFEAGDDGKRLDVEIGS